MLEPTPTGLLAVVSKQGGSNPLERLSIVIPARDEAGCIASTVEHLHLELRLHGIPHEIVVVDDGSTDDTWAILLATAARITELMPVRNPGPNGFGRAVQKGFSASSGDAVVVMMADESDDCRDVIRYWGVLQEGYDCVFGSRFMKQGGTIDYPRAKWIVNRLANLFIRILFRIHLNDTTNAFKAYRRAVIDGCGPILSPHFNITVELPLKAIVRGYTWTTIPITWRNRRTGIAKLKIREMGSRYLFIVAYVWLERYFSGGDYRKVADPNGITQRCNPPEDQTTTSSLLQNKSATKRNPETYTNPSTANIPAVTTAVGACVLLPFIWLFSTNVPVADDWDLLQTITGWNNKGIDARSLLALHNEHCIAFPRLIQHALLTASGGNFQYVLFANGILSLATLWILVRAVCRWPLPTTLLATVATALALLVTAWCQWQNWLWAFQTPWFLLPLMLVSAALGVARTRTVWQALAIAAAAAFAGLLCMANGLFVGWALSPAMFMRARSAPRREAIVAGVVFGACILTTTVIGAKLIGSSSGPQEGGLLAVLSAPLDSIRCALAILGSPFDAENAFLGKKGISTLAGTISLAIGIAAAIWTRRLPTAKQQAAGPGLALMAYGLLSVGAVVFGRLSAISATAIESRYLAFSVAWHAGMLFCLACGAAWLTDQRERLICRRTTAATAGVMIAATVAAMPFFFTHGRNMRNALLVHQSIYRNACSTEGHVRLETISRHYGAERLMKNFEQMEQAGIAHRDYSPHPIHPNAVP